MKMKKLLGLASALCLVTKVASAQPASANGFGASSETNEMQLLKQQMQEMHENFDRKLAAQAEEIAALKKQVGGLPPAPMLGASSGVASAATGQGNFAPTQTAMEPKP